MVRKFASDVERVELVCPAEEGKTQQQFKEEADINTLVRRFGLTGKLPDNVRVPVTGDFTDVKDFQTSLNAVINAQNSFMELPSAIRKRFANDPQALMEFMANPDNRDEAIKLGLVSKPAEVPRDAVMAIDELAAKLVVPKATA